MALRQKIRRLEKATNIDDKKYDIWIRRGLVISPTETIWFDDEEAWRRYNAEQEALEQQPGNRKSYEDLE